MNHHDAARRSRLCDYLSDQPHPDRDGPPETCIIGVFEGTGIGPEMIRASLQLLSAITDATGRRFEIRRGGMIGEAADQAHGLPLPGEAVEFCKSVFAGGGAVLSGPGGGRYVYDLRREFDLFCKFVPVRPWPELRDVGCLRSRHVEGLDFLIVRDNTGGVYQGQWQIESGASGRLASHQFHYTEAHVRRIVDVAVRAAADRRGRLHVVVKDAGVPSISALWCEAVRDAAERRGIESHVINVDLAAYQLIQHPGLFDVIVTPNLVGDILADLAGVLVASRGLTFSGNFTADGRGVYQTNHGCAHDLAGRDVANPAGQMLSLAMLLRESFGLHQEAALIERALAAAWRRGERTADIATTGDIALGTRAMTERVVAQIPELTAAATAA